jgi:hypothetical protein
MSEWVKVQWQERISFVEVVKSTEKSVWIKKKKTNLGSATESYEEVRVNRQGQYESYFETFELAKNYLIRHWERQVDSARRNLEETSSKLGNAKGLKESQVRNPVTRTH